MLIEVSSRICFYHVAKCFQDDSQIQDQMFPHVATDQRISVSGRVTLTESEQEIAFISDFVRVFDVSLQQYLPIITNESEHRFINLQAKEPTLSKNILIFV